MARTRRDQLRISLGRAARRLRPDWPPTLDPPPPPDVPPGATVGPPAWIGIGAPRSGSTWWTRRLADHPLIPRRTKELHFFDRAYQRDFGPADIAAYHRHFPRVGEEQPGEWTPGYLYEPWAAAPLRAAAPEARLLVILRDPVEQLVSSVNYSHVVHGAPDNALMLTRHLGEAAYHRHLRHWVRTTGLPVLVLQLEHCRDDVVGQRDRTLQFLGLDPTAAPAPRTGVVNAGQAKPLHITDAARRSIAELLADDVRRLAEDFPDVDPGRWPSFRDL